MNEMNTLKRDKKCLFTINYILSLEAAIEWANRWTKIYKEYNTLIPAGKDNPGLFRVTNLYDPGFHWIPIEERLRLSEDYYTKL